MRGRSIMDEESHVEAAGEPRGMFAWLPTAWLAALAALLLTGCELPPEPGFRQVVPEPERPAAFPPEMEPYREAYLASEVDYNAVEAKLAATEPWESKFLGLPYLPAGAEYPRDRNGTPLALLAQINFAEMPPLPDFPAEGIVQFFVSPEDSDDHAYGSLFYSGRPFDPEEWFESMRTQDYFRVVYHEQVVEDPEQLRRRTPPIPDGDLPIDREALLTFTRRTGHVLNDDYRFEKVFGERAYPFFDRFGDEAAAIGSQYFRFSYEYAIARIGGYAVFSQGDPRAVRPDEDWVLLLEIESSGAGEEVGVLWGDAGVGAFFIRRDDMRRRDFSNVLYYWDNY